jgi:hypothetical protein
MASIKPSTAHAVIHYILGVWEASRDNNWQVWDKNPGGLLFGSIKVIKL